MNSTLTITYYHHSGFSVASGDILCVFDYWRGEHLELPRTRRLTRAVMARYNAVYVFITHSHPDHYDPVVYEWKDEPNVHYIISDEMPEECIGDRMAEGDSLTLQDRLQVKAYGSTDLGVSYLVTLDGHTIFHAGDLNNWHWREESTGAQIEQARSEFEAAVSAMRGEPIDVCFFPVDPRQGLMFEAGANYFIMSMHPRLFIPMHFWRRAELIREFAQRTADEKTIIEVLSRPGDRMILSFRDLTLVDVLVSSTGASPDTAPEDDGYSGSDPFADTDMPLREDRGE